MIFKKQAEKDFRVKDTTSAQMMAKVAECANIYRGTPYWLDADLSLIHISEPTRRS